LQDFPAAIEQEKKRGGTNQKTLTERKANDGIEHRPSPPFR